MVFKLEFVITLQLIAQYQLNQESKVYYLKLRKFQLQDWNVERLQKQLLQVMVLIDLVSYSQKEKKVG